MGKWFYLIGSIVFFILSIFAEGENKTFFYLTAGWIFNATAYLAGKIDELK